MQRVTVSVFCLQNSKMTILRTNLVIFAFCLQKKHTNTHSMMPEPYLSFSLTKFQNAILAILFKVRPSQPEKNAKIAFLNFVSKKLRFGSGIIGWVFVCVFCKQNAKMTKFVRKIVIFEFCKQNTLTVTLCRMPEPYLSFLQTEFKNVILAIFFVNILLGAPELWCPGTRSLVPFQAD